MKYIHIQNSIEDIELNNIIKAIGHIAEIYLSIYDF